MSATDTRTETIENAALDDVRPGDHLTWTRVWERDGVTANTSREGIAHRRGDDDDWWTKGGMYITNGEGEGVTLTIRRRAVKELPTKPDTVIVPADGHKIVTATDPEDGTVWRTREAACLSRAHWAGVWRNEDGIVSSVMPGALIDADTWREDDA